MTTAFDATLVDTNVLVFSLDQEAPEHAAARFVTDLARNATANLYVAPQAGWLPKTIGFSSFADSSRVFTGCTLPDVHDITAFRKAVI
jgi:hypothetical protein